MRTPLSKVVRILRLTSHVTRWERSTAYFEIWIDEVIAAAFRSLHNRDIPLL